MTVCIYLFGSIGAGIAEFLDHYHQRKKKCPKYVKSLYYWGNVIFMLILGGLLVWVYDDNGLKISKILAINIGISAPVIAAQLTGKKQQISE